jgi:phthalate 4,5-dioxygenase oxygenase subunit
MITESMGPVCDRTKEHLGSTDRAITRMRNLLLKAARDLAAGIEPATGPDPVLLTLRGGERILDVEEDWRLIGSDEDPVIVEGYVARAGADGDED